MLPKEGGDLAAFRNDLIHFELAAGDLGQPKNFAAIRHDQRVANVAFRYRLRRGPVSRGWGA